MVLLSTDVVQMISLYRIPTSLNIADTAFEIPLDILEVIPTDADVVLLARFLSVADNFKIADEVFSACFNPVADSFTDADDALIACFVSDADSLNVADVALLIFLFSIAVNFAYTSTVFG
jgi:hypothetical protein